MVEAFFPFSPPLLVSGAPAGAEETTSGRGTPESGGQRDGRGRGYLVGCKQSEGELSQFAMIHQGRGTF